MEEVKVHHFVGGEAVPGMVDRAQRLPALSRPDAHGKFWQILIIFGDDGLYLQLRTGEAEVFNHADSSEVYCPS